MFNYRLTKIIYCLCIVVLDYNFVSFPHQWSMKEPGSQCLEHIIRVGRGMFKNEQRTLLEKKLSVLDALQ